jgi:uncharacterized low-complexity protein
MKDTNFRQGSTLTAVALLLTLSAAVAQAAPVQSDTSLFQVSEIHGTQLAAKEANQQCATQGGVHKGNPIVNNKFTEHVCAAHVFHPKRKAMEARERKTGKEQQCASKPATK